MRPYSLNCSSSGESGLCGGEYRDDASDSDFMLTDARSSTMRSVNVKEVNTWPKSREEHGTYRRPRSLMTARLSKVMGVRERRSVVDQSR